MAKQQTNQTFIYKLPSKRLRQSHWDLTLPLSDAMNHKNDIVALSDSQLLRWICELNEMEDLDTEGTLIRKELKRIKKLPKSEQTKKQVKDLYKKLYSLQYQKDYFYMIMNTKKDYLRANEGFKINHQSYHRLLGTNGGIKKSTITYIGEHIFDEIKKRMDNSRDQTKKLIPAKLEAYQALICSSSTPVTMPRMVIVNDCEVHFQEDVIRICDDNGEEPQVTYEKDYEINYCDSDGYGLMSPEYSRTVNKDLFGDSYEGKTITGINTRFAWTKGMLFTFDFVAFAKRVNHENYIIKDAWGQNRAVRDCDVILTTSMVKLWDSYNSLEHFLQCCKENHYQFSVSKTTPHRLENVRNANYQFLQTYDFTDKELYQLCKPTIDEITDVLGNDWRKTIVFLKGMYLNEEHVDHIPNDFIKALMIDKRMQADPFVRDKVYKMIKKRIQMAAKGSIKLPGNFAIVSGDLYSLAQSIFGLPITGLLKPGEVYHKYWIDKNVQEIACFRAPMTCHNNIRKRTVVHNEEMDFWYQYNQTGLILNSWDTTCDALNGADKDSDAFFTTDHEIIVKNTRNAMTIECVQRKAEKIIPSESDLVQANILSFGDEIGSTTNKITAMIELQSSFPKESLEYKTLEYRILCGQHFQQNSIDKAKGILAKPMPKFWYDRASCNQMPEDTKEEKELKELCLKTVADKKPYFLKYVYPDLMTQYNRYMTNTNKKCIREYKMTMEEFNKKPDKTVQEKEFMAYHKKLMPVGNNPCTINRICWLIEETFGSFLKKNPPAMDFDESILKSKVPYSNNDYKKIKKIKSDYDDAVKYYQQLSKTMRLDKDEVNGNRTMLIQKFRSACEEICSNEDQLCDILIDLCYITSKSKQFVWDLCGSTMIKHLLEKNNYTIHYPVWAESNGEFEFAGEPFIMTTKTIRKDEKL